MNDGMICQGRRLNSGDLQWLKAWVEERAAWSRKRLARTLCEHWDWRNGRGHLKDFAARSFLLKLENRGLFSLPPLRTWQRRLPRSSSVEDVPPPAEEICGLLRDLQPLRWIQPAPRSPEAARWAGYLERYHYCRLRVVGENVRYLVQDHSERDLACMLFGAAAWRCAARDQWLGWSEDERAERLSEVVNHTRFLILPWVKVPHLASHILGAAMRRLNQDWMKRYSHDIRWVETFVERDRHPGVCYRAANWTHVGQTTGRSRQDRDRTRKVPIKDVFLYPLRREDRRVRGKGGRK